MLRNRCWGGRRQVIKRSIDSVLFVLFCLRSRKRFALFTVAPWFPFRNGGGESTFDDTQKQHCGFLLGWAGLVLSFNQPGQRAPGGKLEQFLVSCGLTLGARDSPLFSLPLRYSLAARLLFVFDAVSCCELFNASISSIYRIVSQEVYLPMARSS